MKRYILALLAIFTSASAMAQSGVLDASFAQQGSYVFRPDTVTVCDESIIDASGRIVMAGWMEMPNSSNRVPMLLRLNENGMPDMSFGTGGYMDVSQVDIPGNLPYFGTVAQQSNGKYVALGYDNYDGHQLFRFNEDGGFDNSFSSTPFMLHRAGMYSSIVDSQDRTVIACFYFPDDDIYQYYGNVAVMRFAADGALDLSFGEGGMRLIGNLENDERCYDIAVDEFDNVYVSGYWAPSLGGGTSSARVYSLNTAGQLRSDFGADGVVEVAVGSGVYNGFSGVAVTNNGDILACGHRYTTQTFIQQGTIMRFTPQGQTIASFGTGGVHLSNDSDAEYRKIAELPNGHIAVAARVKNPSFDYDARISLVDAGGVTVETFGTAGNSSLFDVGAGDESPKDVLVDTNANILVAGYGFAVAENPELGILYGTKGFIARYTNSPLSRVEDIASEQTDVYPNPVSSILYCTHAVGQSYTLINTNGQIIDSGVYNTNGLDLSQLPLGIYLLKMEDSTHVVVRE